MPDASQKPTINDVARVAGVSKKTVSRVINRSPLLNSETRAKVEAVIAALGYVPNSQARALALRRGSGGGQGGAASGVGGQVHVRAFVPLPEASRGGGPPWPSTMLTDASDGAWLAIASASSGVRFGRRSNSVSS